MNLLGKGERRRLRVTLTPIAAGFLAGRLVSYPLLALTARGINDHFGSLLTKGRRDPKIIALEVLSILGVVLFARIDWPRLLHPRALSARGGHAHKFDTAQDPRPRWWL